MADQEAASKQPTSGGMLRGGLKIGRLFGINIFIDWSWLFIFFLVTWNLSVVFGQWHEDWSAALRWSTALVASLLFFASVIAHEISHSLVAKAWGIPVRNITLFLFGGVSNIQRDPPSPKSEFLMAVVGPITSIVIGIIFGLLASVSVGQIDSSAMENPEKLLAELGPVSTLLFWLGPINILVGLFNLIPGFPLDGGRILRSIFWIISGNLRRSTRWAANVGQGVAWLFIIFGLWSVFSGGNIGALWFVFIGWFLNMAATQSYRQVIIKDVLEDVPVSRMMRRDPPTVTRGTSVDDLVHEHIMGSDDYAFPVIEDNRLMGLVTLQDVRKCPRENWQQTPVGQIMTPADELVTVKPDDESSDALQTLTQREFRQLPVVEGDQLVGLLRRSDIIRWLQLHQDINIG